MSSNCLLRDSALALLAGSPVPTLGEVLFSSAGNVEALAESLAALIVSENFERLDDPLAALRDGFGLLRPGGRLMLIVSASHGGAERSHTPVSLLRDIDAMLGPTAYNVVQLAEGGRADHGGGEIVLVLEKALPAGADMPLQTQELRKAAFAEAVVPFENPDGTPVQSVPTLRPAGHLGVLDYRPQVAVVRRILVLKLDHFGDFVIGLPALEALRRAFPDATIRMICGRWNADNAQHCGLVDEVRTYDYFPEKPTHWDGQPVESREAFARAAEGHFDIAVDLRVDGDTRHLLGLVDATLRCGIGSKARFPMLDVALPMEIGAPGTPDSLRYAQRLAPDRFASCMPVRTQFYQETDFRHSNRFLVHGPGIQLPVGRYAAYFALRAHRVLPRIGRFRITLDIARDGKRVASIDFRRMAIRSLQGLTGPLEFTNDEAGARYEFRIYCAGRPLTGALRFYGVELRTLAMESTARFAPGELHVGEKLALLVELIRQRTSDLYRSLFGNLTPQSESRDQHFDVPAGTRRIMLAPISNSTTRDWPAARYAQLIDRLLKRFDCRIYLIGSPAQAQRLQGMIAGFPSDKVINLAGHTAWGDIPRVLRLADLVICNNSGIAHQAASLGVRTLAIYSASHQPVEWGPRGRQSMALMAPVACSPCGFEHKELCPHDHACMQLITPDDVLSHALSLLETTA